MVEAIRDSSFSCSSIRFVKSSKLGGTLLISSGLAGSRLISRYSLEVQLLQGRLEGLEQKNREIVGHSHFFAFPCIATRIPMIDGSWGEYYQIWEHFVAFVFVAFISSVTSPRDPIEDILSLIGFTSIEPMEESLPAMEEPQLAFI